MELETKFKNILLNKIKFINLKNYQNKGFLLKDKKAIFYTNDLLFKFNIDENFNNLTHYFFNKYNDLVLFKDVNKTENLFNDINNFLETQEKIDLPKNEFFGFIEIVFKNKLFEKKLFFSMENDNLRIENKSYLRYNEDASFSFEYELESKQNFQFKINENFKYLIKFLNKIKTFDCFIKQVNQKDLFIVKNKDYEFLTLCN